MDLKEKLNKIKVKLMKEIEKAAKNGDTNNIVTKSQLLGFIEINEKKLSEVENFIFKFNNDVNITSEIQLNDPITQKTSSRQKSKELKEKLLHFLSAKGIYLNHQRGSIYITDSHKLVGIAYANFDKKNINHWFLGLPLKNYKAIILLCVHSNGEYITFILPEDFFNSFKNKFSKDHNDQIKFNVFYNYGKYTLKIPGVPDQNLNSFIDNYSAL